MIRIFSVYYPTRILVLVIGEAIVITASLLLGAVFRLGEDSLLVLQYEYGFYKIFGLTTVALICIAYFDLYDSPRVPLEGETYFRILVVLGLLSFLLAGLSYFFPSLLIGNHAFLAGLLILSFSIFGWRSSYAWLLRLPLFRERVYVLGGGERAQRLVAILRGRQDLGMDVSGWAGAMGSGTATREDLGNFLLDLTGQRKVDRVIVALGDRRGTMPVRQLLSLRLNGIKVEEATALLERVSGKIEIEELYPSWLIFSEGFRLNQAFLQARRIVSTLIAFACLIVLMPLVPVIALVIRLTSAGPVFYRQRRVGMKGVVFTCFKFRTMRADAEADTGPTWAADDDPRVTQVGRWLRRTRLDEIPQLWNVLRGDMGFVGPRPERPEFVQWLSEEIPYYHLRHTIPPGISGWAQVNYPYGASVEDAKEKLRYDLYYIKNISLSFDIFIVFKTLKIVLFGRGAR